MLSSGALPRFRARSNRPPFAAHESCLTRLASRFPRACPSPHSRGEESRGEESRGEESRRGATTRGLAARFAHPHPSPPHRFLLDSTCRPRRRRGLAPPQHRRDVNRAKAAEGWRVACASRSECMARGVGITPDARARVPGGPPSSFSSVRFRAIARNFRGTIPRNDSEERFRGTIPRNDSERVFSGSVFFRSALNTSGLGTRVSVAHNRAPHHS